jgi:hypothetical protein
MSLTIKDNTKTFLPVPAGLHMARCYAVIDIGLQTNVQYNTRSPKILIGWEFPNALMESGKPFIHLQRYTASLSEKSHLRKCLESWRGKELTTEELQGFPLKTLLGMTCYMTIKHRLDAKSNQCWSDILSLCPLPEGVTCPSPLNPVIYFDNDDYSDTVYRAVPENIRKKITLTPPNAASALPAASPSGTSPLPLQSEITDDLDQDIPQ